VTLRHYPRLELPPAFGDSTSWRRVDREPVRLERLGRIRWRVRVGEGAPHRVVCATRSGAVVADCDCAGWRYGRWCAHVAAVFRAYVRRELDLADLDRGPAEEVEALWRGRARVDG
jgi:hypothetical protein